MFGKVIIGVGIQGQSEKVSGIENRKHKLVK